MGGGWRGLHANNENAAGKSIANHSLVSSGALSFSLRNYRRQAGLHAGGYGAPPPISRGPQGIPQTKQEGTERLLLVFFRFNETRNLPSYKSYCVLRCMYTSATWCDDAVTGPSCCYPLIWCCCFLSSSNRCSKYSSSKTCSSSSSSSCCCYWHVHTP